MGKSGSTPIVRVVLALGEDRIRLRSNKPYQVVTPDGQIVATEQGGQWAVVEVDASRFLTIDGKSWSRSSVVLVPSVDDGLSLNLPAPRGWKIPARYAGAMRVSVTDDGRIKVINELDVETYVACVVASEIWPSFEEEAYRVQAIIARTFVLDQMVRRQGRDYDVSATEASQVYRGLRTDDVAIRSAQATDYTRGLVCAWKDGSSSVLFPTYYHAACGGLTQSAEIFSTTGVVPPLCGGVVCDHCRGAPEGDYRWGPVELDRAEVYRRLVRRYPDLSCLGSIQDVEVVERFGESRAVSLRITGSGGKTKDIMAERFRLAVGSRSMRSTDCRIRVVGSKVVFDQGRGFGHGLGLCQWGMQGLARKGMGAADILQFYYPGSHIAKAY